MSQRPIDFLLTVERTSALKLYNMGKATQSLIVILIVMTGITFAASAMETGATVASSGGNVDSSGQRVSTQIENSSNYFSFNLHYRLGYP